jgi:hypothetical protein
VIRVAVTLAAVGGTLLFLAAPAGVVGEDNYNNGKDFTAEPMGNTIPLKERLNCNQSGCGVESIPAGS